MRRTRTPAPEDDPRIEALRLRIFRLLLLVGAGTLLVLGLRTVLFGEGTSWPDLASSAALCAAWAVVGRKPGWRGPTAWCLLALLFLNTLDGLGPGANWPITSTHLLLPLLVLYGTLLGDLRMTALSLAFVLSVYAHTAWRFHPLSRHDLTALTDMVLVSVVSGAMSLAVWSHYRILFRKTIEEAEANDRLHALIVHDIANPLTALAGTVGRMRRTGNAPEDVARLERMTGRMIAIIESVRELRRAGPGSAALARVPLQPVIESLADTFAERLAGKGLRLEASCPEGLAATSDERLLANSLLGNLVSNAIKFSPRGEAIRLSAERDGESVRITVRNAGPGFPEEVVAGIPGNGRYGSRAGTEGEEGMGYGLRIAAHCAGRLGGGLSIGNEPGGAWAAITLPAAKPSGPDGPPRTDLERPAPPGRPPAAPSG
jgi:signal transduction histidine kinase